MIENCFDKDEFVRANDRVTSITRSSGILAFDNGTGDKGKFTFYKNLNVIKFLESSGIELDNDLYYFKLFFGDI